MSKPYIETINQMNESINAIETEIENLDNGLDNRISTKAIAEFKKFGLGGTCKLVSGADLNTCCGQATGFYMGENLTNSPNTGWWFIIHLVHNELYIKQIAFSFSDHQIRIRNKQNGTWTEWVTK